MIHVPRCLVGALCLVLLCACSKSTTDGDGALKAATIKKRDPTRVRVEPVVQREMLRVLETTTRVESEHQVEIMPRTSGVVVEILVEEGHAVVEGQVLARLDARELVIAQSDAEVALEEAKASEPRLALLTREAEAQLSANKRRHEQILRDYERNEAIAQAGPDRPALLSPKDLDASRLLRDNATAEVVAAELALERARLAQLNAKTEARRAQLTLERARLNLANMSLTAPFAGILAARTIKVGDTVTVGSPAFTLTDPQNLRAIFYRPQRELALFARAQVNPDAQAGKQQRGDGSAELELFASAEALPGRRFRGTIERIAPTIDPQSGNFRITARMQVSSEKSADAQLLPGMLVRLEIITERRPNALVIPKRALRRDGDVSLVFVVRDRRAVRVVVREGLSDDEHLEVSPLEGAALAAGELVVVVGNRDLEDGSEVDVALESQGRGHLPPLVEEEGSAAVAEENPADAATQAAAPADGDGDGR
jgi:membrane fusion protein (multidrug efflux system)